MLRTSLKVLLQMCDTTWNSHSGISYIVFINEIYRQQIKQKINYVKSRKVDLRKFNYHIYSHEETFLSHWKKRRDSEKSEVVHAHNANDLLFVPELFVIPTLNPANNYTSQQWLLSKFVIRNQRANSDPFPITCGFHSKFAWFLRSMNRTNIWTHVR